MSGHGGLHRAPGGCDGRCDARESGAHRGDPPDGGGVHREAHGVGVDSARTSGGLHSGAPGRWEVQDIEASGARTTRWRCATSCAPVRAPTMPRTCPRATVRTMEPRRSGLHSLPLHPVRTRNVTNIRCRAPDAHPLSRSTTANKGPLLARKQPLTSHEVSVFPLDHTRHRPGDAAHRPARASPEGRLLPPAPSRCVALVRCAEWRPLRSLVRSTGWGVDATVRTGGVGAAGGEWMPSRCAPGAGGVLLLSGKDGRLAGGGSY